jgi:hypothetical protein
MQRKHSRKEQSKGQVKIEFSPKLITSWGGTAAIMSSFLNKIGFKEIVRTFAYQFYGQQHQDI